MTKKFLIINCTNLFFFHFSVTPLVLVPGMFIFASQSWLTQVLVHGMVLPLLIFCKYQTCLRSYRPQTKFFAMWSLATFAFLFYIYQFHVVGILYWPKTVSPIENLILIGKYLYITYLQFKLQLSVTMMSWVWVWFDLRLFTNQFFDKMLLDSWKLENMSKRNF